MVKLSKRISEERREELRQKYDGQNITCLKCGRYGLLQFRYNTAPSKRYFYCKHGDESCYIGRIEDIERIMEGANVKKDKVQKYKTTRLFDTTTR
jgi:hypothetical protein